MNDRNRIAKAFKELRKRGWFARMNFWCCQSCGCSAVPDKAKNKFVFYHNQDADSINDEGNIGVGWRWRRSGHLTDEVVLYLTHGEGGDGREIVEVLNANGLDASWNGNNNTRILVKHKR